MVVCAAGCGSDPVAELIVDLKAEDVKVRRAAARSLGELGTDAKAAVSALAGAVEDVDPEVRRLASFALGEIGADAKPGMAALTEALDDAQIRVRLAAAFAIRKIDPDNEAYVPELVKAMRMGEGGIIVAVGEMEPKATWAVPTLIELLKDRRPGTRRLAAEALGRIGRDGGDVKAALQSALGDRNDRVREAAQKALNVISGRGTSD